MKIADFFKILKSDRGFSLTEIMIGGAVLAGVALAAAQLFKEQKAAQKNVEYDQRLALFHSGLVKTMNMPSHCNSTLRAFMGGTPAALAATTINNLYMCVPNGAINKCADDNSTADESFDAFTPNAFGPTALLAVNQFIDATRTWQVESMRFLDPRTTTGTTRLRITYKLNTKTNTKSVSKDIFLNLRFFGGVFKECLNNQESSINNLQNDLCKSLNITEVASDGRVATWDEATQTCKMSGVTGTPMKDCSAYNMQVDGIDANGNIRCKPIVHTDDADAVQNTTPVACPAGQKPRMIYNTVTKRMRMVCSP